MLFKLFSSFGHTSGHHASGDMDLDGNKVTECLRKQSIFGKTKARGCFDAKKGDDIQMTS